MASADERAACLCPSRPSAPAAGISFFSVEDGLQAHHAADLAIASKEVSHEGGVLLDDVERPVGDRSVNATLATSNVSVPATTAERAPSW